MCSRKIQTWRDAVDVAKDSLATITAREPVEDAAGDVHRIVTTIGNRDLGHGDNELRRQHRHKGSCAASADEGDRIEAFLLRCDRSRLAQSGTCPLPRPMSAFGGETDIVQ